MKIADLRTDAGKQKAEDGSQMTEDRCRKTDIRLTASLKIGQLNREIGFALVEFIKKRTNDD